MFEKDRGVVHLFLMAGIQIKGQSWGGKRVVKALLRWLSHTSLMPPLCYGLFIAIGEMDDERPLLQTLHLFRLLIMKVRVQDKGAHCLESLARLMVHTSRYACLSASAHSELGNNENMSKNAGRSS